ncbi:MAG: major facilitator transporter [Thaumarchaeota archaeon CSP1-1]|nr:MAG: major facilitator transporter [Thaumarchaeota archaeon CSP1-1]
MKLPILLVYLTALIVGLSYGMHNPIVPVFSKEIIGASYFELGIIGLTNFLPYMFIPLFVGILLDKFNNGLLLSAGIALNTASIYLLSISQSVPEIAFFRALTGMAHAFFWPPCERIISQVEDPENRVKSIARFMGFFVGGLMIGPLIGTFLLENLDVTYRILFQYSTYAIAIAIITSLLLSKYGKTTQHSTIAFGSIKQMTKFPVIVIMLIFCSTAFGTFLTIYPAFMNDRSISESNIELLFFIFGISRLATLAFVGPLQRRTFHSLIATILSIAAGMLVVFYSFTFEMFTIAMLIMGFGFTIYFPLTFEIIMRKSQKKFSGGLIGAYEATFGIGWAAGPLFAGIVAEAFGKDTPYLGFFVIGIIVTLILVLNRKKLQIQWNQNL